MFPTDVLPLSFFTEVKMHGQVTDFMDVLFWETPDVSGEINFVIPRQREFDQELEFDDINDLIQNGDDISLIPDMDILLDPDCQVAETITIEALPNEPSSDSTPSTSGTTQSEPNYFKFPAVDINEFITNMPETTYLDDVTEDESAYLSCSSSQYSPTVPPTPSTASSVDSNSSHIPSFLKQGLKRTIQSRRLQEGKGMLEVEFKEPEPEFLTAEEEEQRMIRREKNKLAAQKCRIKKKERAEVLEAETKKLEKTQGGLKTEIQKLLEERDNLMDIIKVHRAVCPKMRAQSSSF